VNIGDRGKAALDGGDRVDIGRAADADRDIGSKKRARPLDGRPLDGRPLALRLARQSFFS
jgi:hypothetical protein